MWLDFFRVLRTIWPLQQAFDHFARDRPEAALRELERPCFRVFDRFPRSELGIEYRVLLLILSLETGRSSRMGTLLGDIRATRSFNAEARKLLLKYVLTCLWHYKRPEQLCLFRTANELRFNPNLVRPILISRYGGCVGMLENKAAELPR